MDGQDKRLDSLLDRDVSVPIQCHGIHAVLNCIENDGQVSRIDRNRVGVVIEIEETAHVLPKRGLIGAVDDRVHNLFERFLEGKEGFAADKVVAAILECHLKGRAILRRDGHFCSCREQEGSVK